MFYEIKLLCATMLANKLILTPLRPFHIKCKKIMQKTSGNVFLGHLGE